MTKKPGENAKKMTETQTKARLWQELRAGAGRFLSCAKIFGVCATMREVAKIFDF